MSCSSRLSSRAEPFLRERPSLEYSRRQVAGLSNQYIPSSLRCSTDNLSESGNSTGYVLLAVAENKQSALQRMLLDKMKLFHGYDEESLNYTDPSGLPQCKVAMASFLGRYVFGGHSVQASDLTIAPGGQSTSNDIGKIYHF